MPIEFPYFEADQLHALLTQRADDLAICCETGAEERELIRITVALEQYQQKRWPDGKIAGGNG